MDSKRYLPVAVLFGLVVLVQIVISFTGTVYLLTQVTMAAYYSLVVIGLCLLLGYAGQISLGQAGFFAIGGYTSAVISTQNLVQWVDTPLVKGLLRSGMVVERQDLYNNAIVSVSPWIAFLAAILISIAVAFLIGLPIVRLRGHYMAMATLGFGIIIYRIVLGTGFLGEADGISEVPGFKLFFGLEVNGSLPLRIQNYYIAWVLVTLAIIISINLIQSRIGRALRSIHGSDEAANAMGVNTSRYKLYTFVISAVFAAVGGAFLTHYNGGIGPSEAAVMKSVRYLAIVAVGGMGNLWGVLFMGVLLNFLSLRGYFGTFDDAVFGTILVSIMLFAPQGVLRIQRLQGWLKKLKA